jgi:hypothetical protein
MAEEKKNDGANDPIVIHDFGHRDDVMMVL